MIANGHGRRRTWFTSLVRALPGTAAYALVFVAAVGALSSYARFADFDTCLCFGYGQVMLDRGDVWDKDPKAVVTGVVLRPTAVDPRQQTVTFAVTPYFFDTARDQPDPVQVISPDGEPMYDDLAPAGSTPLLSAKPAFLDVPFTLLFDTLDGDVRVSWTLEEVMDVGFQAPGPARTVTLPARARAQAFPQDSFAVDLDLRIDGDAEFMRYEYADGSTRSFGTTLVASFARDDRPVDFSLAAPDSARTPPEDEPGLGSATARLVFSRPPGYTMYVYAIAGTPALFGIALWAQTFLARRRHAAPPSGSLEIAAALLALMALRQVLVPPDVPGFTRLDKLLGLELVVLVALAVWLVRTNAEFEATPASPSGGHAPSPVPPSVPPSPPAAAARPRRTWPPARRSRPRQVGRPGRRLRSDLATTPPRTRSPRAGTTAAPGAEEQT